MQTIQLRFLTLDVLASFCCGELQSIIKWLIALPEGANNIKTSEIMNTPRFQGLYHFLTQTSLKEKVPSQLSAKEDMHALEALLQLIKIMLCTSYSSKRFGGTRDLISHVTDFMLSYYFDDHAELADYKGLINCLTSLFDNDKVLNLVTEQMNKAEHLELLTMLRDTVEDPALALKLKDKIAKFKSYIVDNYTILKQNPYILKNLVHIFLKPGCENTLPKLDNEIVQRFYQHFPEEMQKRFWYFLTQHQPVAAKDVLRLMQFANTVKPKIGNPFVQKMLNNLLEVPAYIPLDFINPPKPSKVPHQSLLEYPAALKSIGDDFKHFLVSRGYVEDKPFFAIIKTDEYEQSVGLYQQLPIKWLQSFFKIAAQYPDIEFELIQQLAEKLSAIDPKAVNPEYLADGIEFDFSMVLRQTLQLAQQIKDYIKTASSLSSDYWTLIKQELLFNLEFGINRKSFTVVLEHVVKKTQDLASEQALFIIKNWFVFYDQLELAADILNMSKQLQELDHYELSVSSEFLKQWMDVLPKHNTLESKRDALTQLTVIVSQYKARIEWGNYLKTLPPRDDRKKLVVPILTLWNKFQQQDVLHIATRMIQIDESRKGKFLSDGNLLKNFVANITQELPNPTLILKQYESFIRWVRSRSDQQKEAGELYSSIELILFHSQQDKSNAFEIIEMMCSCKDVPLDTIFRVMKGCDKKGVQLKPFKEIMQHLQSCFSLYQQKATWMPLLEQLIQYTIENPNAPYHVDLILVLLTQNKLCADPSPFIRQLMNPQLDKASADYLLSLLALLDKFDSTQLLSHNQLSTLYKKDKQKFALCIELLQKQPNFGAVDYQTDILNLLIKYLNSSAYQQTANAKEQAEFLLEWMLRLKNKSPQEIPRYINRINTILDTGNGITTCLSLLQRHTEQQDAILFADVWSKPLDLKIVEQFYANRDVIISSYLPKLFNDFSKNEKSQRIAWVGALLSDWFLIAPYAPAYIHNRAWSTAENQQALDLCLNSYLTQAEKIFAKKTVGVPVNSKTQQRYFSVEQHQQLADLTDELVKISQQHTAAINRVSNTASRDNVMQTKKAVVQRLECYYQPAFFTKMTRSTSRLKRADELARTLSNAQTDNPYEAMLQAITKEKVSLIEADQANAKARLFFKLHKKGSSELYKTLNTIQDMIYEAWSKDPKYALKMHSYRDKMKGEVEVYVKLLTVGVTDWLNKVKNQVIRDKFNSLKAVSGGDTTAYCNQLLQMQADDELGQLPGHLQAIAQEITSHADNTQNKINII